MNKVEWKRGWKVVVAAAVGMGAGIGLWAMVAGLFLIPLETEFGWSRGDIALAAVFGVLSSVVLPILGSLIDRVGARIIAAFGMVALAAGYFLLSQQSGELWFFYGIILMCSIVGHASGPLVFTHVVNSWFQSDRGLALGVALSGVTFSAAILLPILAGVIEAWGWRAGFAVLLVIPLCIGLPFVLFWLKGGPLVSETSDDTTFDVDVNLQVEENAAGPIGVVLKDLRFWLLGGGLFCANIAVGGILSQLQPLLVEVGFSVSVAATLGSVFALSIALGRLGAGWLLDRIWPPGVAFMFLLCPLLGIAILLFNDQPSFVVGAVAVCCFGMAQGAEFDFLAFLVPKYFGLENYGKIFGCLAMIVTVSLAVGAYVFGLLFDLFSSYDPALKGAVIAYVLGAVGVLLSGMVMAASALPSPAK